MEVEKKRSQLLVENSTLSAKLKNTLAALRSGGERRRAIYYEALREIDPEPKTSAAANADLPQRRYVTALTDEYVKLRAEEHSLATKYGDGHPDLADLRNRLISLRESLGLADDVEPSYAPQPDTDVESEIDYISIYVNMLNDGLATVEGQVEELNRIYNDEKEKANSLQSFQIQDEDIRKDLEATERLFDAVVSRLEEINIISENGGDKMDVLAWAQLGTRVSPLLLTSIIPGTMVGFIFGCGLSYLMERSAAMFRSPAEIRTALRVPVIGRIPIIERKRRETPNEFPDMSPMLCTVHRHGSSMAEAYRAVRTSLLYSVGGQNHQVIQVTSPLPGDGKSTLAANLAVTLANSGKRVLLVDADFRRPTLHKLFGINSPATGLVSVVNDEVDAEFAAIETEIPNVSLLPVNERTSNPAELLSNPNFKALLEQLRQQYDFVLVDTPPLLAVTDPSAVAAQVDGVLLVLRIRRGVQVAATRAREMLADVDANVLGVIVNAVDKKSSYGSYGYGYGYGYTTDEGDNPARRTERRAAKRLMVEASHVVN
jgi:capsular exopolysaccharide synthesis family protein